MVRYRASVLLLWIFTNFLAGGTEDVAEDKTGSYQRPPNTPTLQNSFRNWIDVDLAASASEFVGPTYLPPASSYRGRGRGCFECNSEPWIPIAGRSLHFPPTSSSHAISLEESLPHNGLGNNNRQFNRHHPPIDQYGAPQASFTFPRAGEVVEFMLPPPFKTGSIISGIESLRGGYHGPPNPAYAAPKPRHQYGPPKPTFNTFTSNSPNIFNLNPPPLPRGPPPRKPPIATTRLRPVSQDFQPPLPGGGIHTLPLENNLNLPSAMPSDSYGRPISDNFAAPIGSDQDYHQEPITLGSGDSEEYGKRVAFNSQNHFRPQQQSKLSLYQKGLTDVQVVPSVRLADYTASIEYPIDLIQSPILDLNIENEELNQPEDLDNSKLSENPIVVDDTYTSASNINATYFPEENATAIKRHNEKFPNSKEIKPLETDFTDDLIRKLVAEHNIIDNPKNQKSLDYSSSSWTPASSEKQAKKLQIIVPYLKASANDFAIYNKEYTTLAPVFVPPPMTTETANLWTQLVEGIRTVGEHKEKAHGFASTTEVYNIKQFLFKQGYDGTSLQRNIDGWTQQAYANRHNLEGRLTTKLDHVKNIPGEYFTSTPSYRDNTISDNVASSSDKKEEFISNEIDENLILPEPKQIPTTTTAPPHVRFIVRQPKPSWEVNKVTLSNSTHEKVYVVTPQSYTRVVTSTPATAFSMAPRIQNGQVNNASTMTRISMRVESASDQVDEKGPKSLKLVYSEWPHLINDLATTTTPRSTTRHPLFGLMDLAPYTVPADSMVETIGGHSKVVSVTASLNNRYVSTTPTTPREISNETTALVSPVT